MKNRQLANVILLSLLMSAPAWPATAAPPPGQGAGDVGYAWVIIRFNFPCPSAGSNKPQAIWTMQLGNGRERRYSAGCYLSGNRSKRGVVVRMNTRGRPPMSELKIQTSNCAASRIYTQEPAEWNSDEYDRRSF